jgi:putative PIN family toxin of toxin-antitoxin system
MAVNGGQRPRVVLDTTTLLRAIPTKSSLRYIIEAFTSDRFIVVVSNDILLEYEEVLRALGGPQAWPAFEEFLRDHVGNVIRVDPTYHWHAIKRDPDDNKFVDAAVTGGAAWIVTDDHHFDDLHADSRLIVRPIRAEEFIALLRGLE